MGLMYDTFVRDLTDIKISPSLLERRLVRLLVLAQL